MWKIVEVRRKRHFVFSYDYVFISVNQASTANKKQVGRILFITLFLRKCILFTTYIIVLVSDSLM